jgi:hypothetical protein
LAEARAAYEPDDFWLEGFFTQSPRSRAAGEAFLKRLDARVENRDTPAPEQRAIEA